MNMKVVFQDNREGFVDSKILDQMIAWNKVRMFMRTEGWAMVGIHPVRGMGGDYSGVERRGTGWMTDSNGNIIAA